MKREEEEPRELSVARGAALAFALALLGTLVMAAPVALAPSDRLFGGGETYGREDPNRDPLVVIEQFRTGQVPAPYLQPLTDLAGRVLARPLGPVAAYNVLVLASFPLAAVAAYLLGRSTLGSHPGALVAGLAYAFLPFHVAHATGHPHVAQTQWLPLYLLALWQCVDRPDVLRVVLLLASAAAVTLSNFYGGLIAAVVTPVALLAYGVFAPRPFNRRWRHLGLTGLALGAAVAAALLLIEQLAPVVAHDPRAFAFPRSDLFLYSAKWWSYLVPAADHLLVASRVREFWAARGLEGAVVEQQVGLGWSLLALGAVPLWLWLRGERTPLAVRTAPVFASIAVVAFLCSLSPERRVWSLTFVRPSAVLYALVPMFRAYARFGVAVGLMTALLAGGGAACLWQGRTLVARGAATLLLVLAVLEYAPFPPWRWRDVLPTRAHRWLAELAGPKRVLDCVSSFRGSDALALGLFPHEITHLGPSVEDCAEPELGSKLAALGYSHVIVRRDGEGSRPGQPAPEGLGPGPAFEDSRVFMVKAERPWAFVERLGGFYPREYEGPTSWRWMGQTGSVTVVNTGTEAIATVLELELMAFPGDRRVTWSLDRRRLGELAVVPEWRRYVIPVGAIAPGETVLTLACRGPAVAADEILGNTDPRLLCLAVADWKVERPPKMAPRADAQ